MANNKGDGIAFATPRSSTWIVLNCILFVIVLDFCCVSIGDLTRNCLVFLKDRRFGCLVFEFWMLRFRSLRASFSRFGCSIFEIWVLRFRDLGASFSRFGCFVFEIWVLRFRDMGASCFGLRFRVLRFRNYHSCFGLRFWNYHLSHLYIVWNMCEHLHYELVYFKELHKEQEYYIQSGGSCSVNYY